MKSQIKKTESGQIVVEYVLLLVVAVSLAFLIGNTIGKRDPESPGFLIQKWKTVWEAIGRDNPEKVN